MNRSKNTMSAIPGSDAASDLGTELPYSMWAEEIQREIKRSGTVNMCILLFVETYSKGGRPNMLFELYEGEMINFDLVNPDMGYTDDEIINKKYVSGEVRIVTEQARYPLDNIVPMLDSGKYQLTPEYQRRHRWDNDKKSKLIESFIMNVPIPPIFLYETDYSFYEVMDGLQRLTAINEFYKEQYSLSGLELWPELNGRTYSTLPNKIRQGIDRRYVSSIILLQESAHSEEEALRMKQLVFERINSGGVKLEPQETRNALHNGPMNALCIELSKNIYLRRLFGIPYVNDSGDPTMDSEYAVSKDSIEEKLDVHPLYRDMSDVELVLRFFALRNIDGYSKRTFHNFLDAYLNSANHFSAHVLNELSSLFEETVKFAFDLFGEKAFKLVRKRKTQEGESWTWYNRSATTVYDPLMQVLSQLLGKKEKLISQAAPIREKIKLIYQENYSIFEGRNNNKNNIEERYRVFHDFLSSYLD